MKQTKHYEKKSFPTSVWQMLLHIFFHNGWFKLLALLLSIMLWAGLISQDETLTRDKTFTDVSVNVTGTDAMKRNGYIVVSDLTEALKGVSATAAVPQQQYERAEISTYNVRLDLSRISATGEQELRLQSTNSSTYGRITSLTPASVKVEVEDYVVRYRIPVSVSISGDVPEGWYISSPSVDPPLVAVSGPRSLVSTISRARVFLDPAEVEWKEGTALLTCGLKLYSRTGEEMNNSLLEISYDNVMLDSVVLEATVLPIKRFDVSSMIGMVNDVAEGYEVKQIDYTPESISVAARSEVLEQMNELALSEYLVDLGGLRETKTFQIKVSKPSEDAVLSNDTITVTVEVSPKEAESAGEA